MVICLERVADLHTAQLMPLPLTVSCFSKIQIGFTFLVPAHLGSPGQRAVERVCVCVTASSTVLWSRFSPPSNFVKRHVSTMWFMVCRWPQSQEGDWERPNLCKLASRVMSGYDCLSKCNVSFHWNVSDEADRMSSKSHDVSYMLLFTCYQTATHICSVD